MDILLAIRQYINEMVGCIFEGSFFEGLFKVRLTGPGMKVILMDKETVFLNKQLKCNLFNIF
jgi:hypothetical protein